MKTFKATFSKCMLFSTCIVAAFIIYAIVSCVISIVRHGSNHLSLLIIICVLIAALVVAFLLQPMYIEVTNSEVIIKKRLGSIKVPISNILDIREKNHLFTDIRIFGISGLFGHIGLFWNKRIGKFTVYATNGNSLVEIRTKEQTYVISCDNREAFILDISKAIRDYKQQTI